MQHVQPTAPPAPNAAAVRVKLRITGKLEFRDASGSVIKTVPFMGTPITSQEQGDGDNSK